MQSFLIIFSFYFKKIIFLSMLTLNPLIIQQKIREVLAFKRQTSTKFAFHLELPKFVFIKWLDYLFTHDVIRRDCSSTYSFTFLHF